jgi:hypothetical protein
VNAAVKTCDDGALASSRLQAGAQGGPDAKASVKCDAGYSLCRIDPKGKDNDVCTDPNDCYACSKPVATAATCNLPPKFGKLCPPGSGSCVQDPKGQPGDGICQAAPAQPTCNLPPKFGKLCPPGSGYSCVQDPQGQPGDGICQTAPAANACVAAGGACVALTPSSCPSPKHVGDARTYSCGGGLGVECCLP